MLGTLGACPYRNYAFRDYRVRAENFQLRKCNARIHTGFYVGGGEGEMCGRW